jgi:AP endonuclease 2
MDVVSTGRLEEGFSGCLGSEHIGPLPVYPDVTDGRDVDGSYQFSIARLDTEGRCVITDHRAFVLFNVYFPAGGSGEESRLAFKAQFNAAFELRVRALLASGRDVVVVGDVNIAHRAVDHCDPAMWEKEARVKFDDSPNRQWLSSFLGQAPVSAADTSSKRYFVDSFRAHHPSREKAFTCWNSVTSARLTNYGTRLDYILPCDRLASAVVECDIRADIQGSDHCPVYAVLDVACGEVPADPPSLWAGNLPELSGKQAKLHDYFSHSPVVPEDVVEVVAGSSTADVPPEKRHSSFGTSGNTTSDCSGQPGGSKKRKLTVTKPPTQRSSLMSYFGCKAPPTPQEDVVVVDFDHSNDGVEVVVEKDDVAVDSGETQSFLSQVSQSSHDVSVIAPPGTLSSWKSLFRGPLPPPLCKHKEPCVERTVLKKGPNMGKV